jgi:hypothetical protein
MKKRGTASDDGLYGAASLALFVRSGIIRTLWCQFSYLYCAIWHHSVSLVSLLLSLLCDLASYDLFGAASLALFVRSGIIRTLWCHFSYLYCPIWHHSDAMVPILLSLLCDLASFGLYGVTSLIFIVRSGIIRSLWCHFSYLYCPIWHHRAFMVPLPFFM